MTKIFRRSSATTFDRLTSPNSLFIRILAVVGIIFLIERTASFYYTTAKESNVITASHHSVTLSPPEILSFDTENSGIIRATGEKKSIIVASTTWENTSWIRENFADWNLNIYVVNDENAELTVSRQGGNEAAVFLTYIINNYYNLPDYMVFQHANRYQWHNEDPMYDGVPPIKNLRLENVKEVGYASLRCSWRPGCPDEMIPETPDLPNDPMDPYGVRKVYADAFGKFFPDVSMPKVVGAPCCAQFAVTRDQIRKRPIIQYERVRQWLWETDIHAGITGRVMEYLWHILMSMPDVSCPQTEQCFCERFGHCKLDCPEEGFCKGRFHMLSWSTNSLPKNWPEEGQGEKDYPTYGWWQDVYPGETWGLEHTDMSRKIDFQVEEEQLGAGGEGWTEEELEEADEELKKLNPGNVFGSDEDSDVTIITSPEELARLQDEKKQEEEWANAPSDDFLEAEAARRKAEKGKGRHKKEQRRR